MKITSLDVRCVKVPMREPHRTATGVVEASPLVLLTLKTDAGFQGHSITFTYSPAALGPTAQLMKNMEPLVCGRELVPAFLSDELHGRFKLLGTQGMVGMVLSAIDMALWDAMARTQQLPLYKLLGSAARPLACYAGVGFDGEAGSAIAAEAWAKKGFTAVKAKIGYPTLVQDIAVVRAMRAAVGPDVQIMVDYNQSLHPTEAAARLRALDAEDLCWIEEPVLAHDYAALANLSQLTITPLQAGESWWGPLDFQHAFDAGVCDLIMLDAMRCGGVTGWMRIAAMAHVRGIQISSHLWPDISAQLLCATSTAHWLEYIDWWNPILEEPMTVANGMVDVDGVMGSGVCFDEKAVTAFLV